MNPGLNSLNRPPPRPYIVPYRSLPDLNLVRSSYRDYIPLFPTNPQALHQRVRLLEKGEREMLIQGGPSSPFFRISDLESRV